MRTPRRIRIGLDDLARLPSRSTRRIAVGAVLGALVALVGVGFWGGVGGGAQLTASDEASTAQPVQPLRAPVHSCLTWTELDASDARQVPCSQPHLFEVIGTVQLDGPGQVDSPGQVDGYGPGAPFPDAERWHELVTTRCLERAVEALAGGFDPFGRFTVGAIKPSEESWQRGDRTLRCGVQVVGRGGTLFHTTGSIVSQDQSDVHPPGTCLANDGKGVGDLTDCANPHAVEVVGVVDLRTAFADGYPDEAAQDRLLDRECTRLATEFAGGEDVAAEKGLTVFWETLRPESWQVGSTRVDCRLGAFLPDRSGFAPVTGSVRGEVRIGTEPAAAAPENPGPSPVVLPPVTEAATPEPPG